MGTTTNRFAKRLTRALDHARFPDGRTRTSALAMHFNVSRETARKWLSGIALPEMERMIEMAVDFRVSFEWLATGRGEMTAATRVAETNGSYQDPELQGLLAQVSRLPEVKRRALQLLLSGK